MSRTMSVLCAALLLIGTAFIYSPALNGPFLFDDLTFIVHSPDLQGDISFNSILRSSRGQLTRFVGFLTFAVNYRLGGLETFGYHRFNLLAHVAVVFLVWQLFRLIFIPPSHNTPGFSPGMGKRRDSAPRGAGRKEPRALARGGSITPGVLSSPQGCYYHPRGDGEAAAFAGAFLFAVHPLQTQAVSYISQRFTVLAALFYVGGLVFYLHGRLRAEQFQARARCFAGAFFCGVLGLFTKEITLTLPLAIVLLEICVIRGKRPRIGVWLGTFVVFAGILSLTFSWRKLASMLGESIPSESFPGDVLTFGTYALTEGRVLMTLLRLFALPFNQNFDYAFPMSHSLLEPSAFLSFAALSLLAAAGFFIRNKFPLVSFGIFWFFLTISVEFIPRANVIWEHKMYLPSIGLCLAVSAGLSAAMKNTKQFAAAWGIIVCILSVLTFQRNILYGNETAFWQDVVRKSPRKLRAYLNLVEARFRQKDYNGALAVYAELLRHNPDSFEGYNGRAALLQKLNRTEEAFADYGKAFAIKPDYIAALVNRGNLYRKEGKLAEALADYGTALNVEPENTTVLSNRGALYLLQKDFISALTDLDRAVKINPRFVDGYINRGAVYFEQGLYEQALKNYNQALARDAYHRDALYNRAIVYFKMEKDILALADIKKVLEVDPDWEPARVFRQQLMR